MGTSRQVVWRWLAAGVCLLTLGQAARADSLDEQRSRYAQIKQAWDNRQMDVVEQLMPTLQTYPLYPYLQYRQLTDDLMNEPTIAVQQFIQANPTLPPARTLTSPVCQRTGAPRRLARPAGVQPATAWQHRGAVQLLLREVEHRRRAAPGRARKISGRPAKTCLRRASASSRRGARPARRIRWLTLSAFALR